ncbi:class F sortase [Pseudonocardia asaccharolytica]|uniref:class F sortase n=2 Tax=Pseudonocardia asaccharolytica TaxID=54010 RepID=UPI001376DD1B|nr:class F sortase [Pseudonocardia asaccharolytica]
MSPPRLTVSRRRRWPAVLIACCGVLCVLIGVVLVAVRPAAEAGGALGTGGTAPAAPESLPAAPGTVPVALALPARGIGAPIVAVGTDPDGGLVVPDPPSTVGWWAPGALAGSGSGTVVLAGHVDSRVEGLGVFAVLPELAAGEPVWVRGRDGRVIEYEVVARRQFAKAQLPAELFARDGAPRLVLITCGGRFDRSTRSYADNVVVYAVPAPAPTPAHR